MTIEIDSETIRDRISVRECVDLLADAMCALHRGEASALPRSKLSLSEDGDMLMTMPGAYQAAGVAGVKALTLKAHGAGPSVQGLITLFDLETGAVVATLDAAPVTELRTAAASALATSHLAHNGARVLTVLGTGVQARSHIEAVAAFRRVERVLICGRSIEKAQSLAVWSEDRLGVEAKGLTSVEDAVAAADIICTVTSSPTPIVKGEWLKPGTHINMVGAHTPSTREVDTDAVKRSRLFVETRSAALEEAGEILIPLKAGDIGESHILGELADLILGVVEPRESQADITAYKSLGNIVQDLAVAHEVVRRVRTNADQ